MNEGCKMKLKDIFKNYINPFLMYFFGIIGFLFVINTILIRVANIQLYSFCIEDIRIIYQSFFTSLVVSIILHFYKKNKLKKDRTG